MGHNDGCWIKCPEQMVSGIECIHAYGNRLRIRQG